MRYLLLLLVILVEIVLVYVMRLLDNFFVIGALLLVAMVSGLALKDKAKRPANISYIGWALFYGTLTTALSIAALFIYTFIALAN